jgi:hypothetical protein
VPDRGGYIRRRGKSAHCHLPPYDLADVLSIMLEAEHKPDGMQQMISLRRTLSSASLPDAGGHRQIFATFRRSI